MTQSMNYNNVVSPGGSSNRMLSWGTSMPTGGSSAVGPGPSPLQPMSFGNTGNVALSMPSVGPVSKNSNLTPNVGYNPSVSAGNIQADLANSARGTNPTEVPGAGGWFGSTFKNKDGGLNLDALSSVGTTLASFGQLYAAFQSNKIAKDSLSFQKESYQTNLSNQLSSYNMALEDRANARAVQSGTPGSAEAYINKHRLGD